MTPHVNTGTLQCELTAKLGRFALDARFVSSHRVTGVFGPSGAGKTSLLECVIGLRSDARGTLRVGEQIWIDSTARIFVPPEQRDVGYVPQAGLLFPHLTARENVLTGRRRARARGLDFERTFASAVAVLELGALLDQPVTVLSGGERQRVALARALCSGPRLLVLDEPLASLDIALQRKLLPYVRRIREEFDVPMLLVSHSPLEVQALCDHVLAIRDGRIVAEGPPSDVLANPSVLAADPSVAAPRSTVFVVDPVDTRASRTHVRLRETEIELVVRGRIDAPSRRLLVSVPAESVMIATSAPAAISAANVLPCRIQSIQGQGDLALIQLTLAEGHPPLLVELTRESTERLGLREAMSVFAVVKASSCELIGSPE